MVLDKSSLLLLITVLTVILLINIGIVFSAIIYRPKDSDKEFTKIGVVLTGSIFSLLLLFILGLTIRVYLSSD